ncbi:hypothetical protein [Gorillibacterium massiliense]|uniref:hypothetical protein n=1 Tax=Gorillibacterium massiliense TaxID=1280390 RepID=UPI0004AE75A7|nr:hypothetical protein [Gorillibacterium massiliense]
MSKLDGNERWNSKMLMTEHQEQYDRKQEAKRSGPTPEELTMLRDYILLPYLLTMVERNYKEMTRSSMLLKKLFVFAAETLMDRISKDMHRLRRELSQRSIKVTGDSQEDMIYYYSFTCRGYQDKFGITRDLMKAQISIMLTQYLANLQANLTAASQQQQAPS